MSEQDSTPREDGLSMPAEWEPHEACLMEWPTLTRKELWGERFEEAQRDYASVANAIAAFEPVVMVCDPEQQAAVRRRCGDGVEVLPLPIDDSWMRDNGPIFVRDAAGRIALVHFGFNSWGEKYLPYDRDAQVPRLIAEHLGMRRYEAPFVLEGGSFFVDGGGTLITTEQCLLNPNRNPALSREQIEQGLRDYLGVEVIVWLRFGHSTDRDTDGHIDGIAPYLAPATVALLLPEDRADPDHERGRDRLQRARCEGPGVRGDPVPDPPAGPRPVPQLLPRERRRDRPDRRSPGGRAGARADREDAPRPGGRARPRQLPQRGRRWTALHHPAASGGRRSPGVRCT
jgi:agmatine deiminase